MLRISQIVKIISKVIPYSDHRYGQIKYSQIRSIQSKYEIIMWDILSRDYLPNLNVRRALRRIKKATRPGSIVVFHDTCKSRKKRKIIIAGLFIIS